MRKIIYIILSFILLNGSSFALTETESISSALKSTNYEPNYFSIILSLFFVILLIYITGILYTKLNKVGVKTVKKEFKGASDIKPVILSTTPVGHDKTLQVIEIAGEKLLVGVSQHSVNLIKTLGVKYNTVKEQDINNHEAMYNKEEKVEDKIKEEHTVNIDDFGLYKKYLR